MGITYRKNDDLEKMLENFATLPKLEGAQEPDPKQTKKSTKKETDA
ncbi:SPJ_0845 family protein [Streptococcus sp. DD12]|nr:SPJ_0845 family protein [Streptococcus sp. DD12]KXT76888.1 hypothetical protein STRDD12_00022 [Streptococcus sp. DD12]